MKTTLLELMRPFYWSFAKIFVKQQNLFAFYISKPAEEESLFPWLSFNKKEHKIKFNKTWGDNHYKTHIQ